jgi:uncharacterized membrane protein YbaN (DUF454 family)
MWHWVRLVSNYAGIIATTVWLVMSMPALLRSHEKFHATLLSNGIVWFFIAIACLRFVIKEAPDTPSRDQFTALIGISVVINTSVTIASWYWKPTTLILWRVSGLLMLTALAVESAMLLAYALKGESRLEETNPRHINHGSENVIPY